MTHSELERQIAELRVIADKLSGTEKTIKLGELARLEIQLKSMALTEIKAKLNTIQLTDVRDIKKKIADAKKANVSRKARANALNSIIKKIKSAIGID